MEKSTIVLVFGLAGAGIAAFVYGGSSSSSAAAPQPVAQQPVEPATNDMGELPPDHPAVDNGAAGNGAPDPAPELARSDAPAALAWTAPAGWTKAPNPNAMRIETYAIPRVAPDTEDADLAITRVGGDVQSNVDRWKGQFEGETKFEQSQKTVRGIPVVVVQIEGTYAGGMDPSAGPRAGWAMLAAIAETKDEPYFFKMTGPVATVRAARKSFDAMIDGLRPTT